MKKKQWIPVAGVLLVLAAAIGVLARLNAPGPDADAGSIAVFRDGESVRTYTMEEIKALPSITVHKEIVSSSHDNDEGDFTGVPLRALLDGADPALLEEGVSVAVKAADGYVSAYAAEEVAESDNILLAYAKDGTGLGTLEDGGTGPFRIVIQEDEFGNRSTKYVYQIEVR